MPRYYFDCLSDGVLYPDEFGDEMLETDVADQAQAVTLNIMQESLPNKGSLVVLVTVRGEQGQPVYVAHGIVGGNAVREAPEYTLEKFVRN